MEKHYSLPNFGDVDLLESSDASFKDDFVDKFEKAVANVEVKAKALKALSSSLSYGTYKDCYADIAKELSEKILSLIMEHDFELSQIRVMPMHSQQTMYSREYSWTSLEFSFHNTNEIVKPQRNFEFGETNASKGIQNEQD